jgi:DNA-binding winged helix-turn-helix (wHTH) protein/TolB-like protein/Tfp pilus assembly protein PilF
MGVDVSTRVEATGHALLVGLQVGEWCVAPELNRISRAGQAVRLEPKAIELLIFLARRPGEVVSREELLAALWPDVIVGDNALTQAVTKLRKAMGDTAREPAYIEAISKRGYRLIASVGYSGVAASQTAPAEPSAPAAPDRLVRQWVIAGSFAAFAASLFFWLVQPAKQGDPLNALPLPVAQTVSDNKPTVFVRPFDSTAEDAQKLIARGLNADLVSDLSKISGLWIVSGAEAGAAQQLGETSGQRPSAGRYLLTGTVLLDGNRLRLHVHLVEADARRHIWSQRFDREMRDLFTVQDEIVRSITEQLPIRISQAETASLARRYTRNVAAYEHFLHGQVAVQVRRRTQNEHARDMYWKAIQLDPAFARAYAGLAMTYALAYQLGWADESALGRALEFAGTAIQMSPEMSETHWVLGFVHTQRRQHHEAINHLQRALSVNPSYADAYALMGGIKTYIGRPADGVSALRTALLLNPDASSLYFLLLGRAYYFLGDLEQARVNLDQALTRNAENLEARVYLAAVLGQLGDRPSATWQADEIRAIEPNFSVQRWLATYPMTDALQKEKLVRALRPLGL